jgi:hypothetical protein
MLAFWVCIHGDAAAAPLAVTYDVAAAELGKLPRLFIEPDGSFVLTGATQDGQPWQVDGNLIDRGDVLAYVELKGSCPSEQFDVLLRALGWPETPLTFQLLQRGVLLDESAFRQLAVTPEGAR